MLFQQTVSNRLLFDPCFLLHAHEVRQLFGGTSFLGGFGTSLVAFLLCVLALLGVVALLFVATQLDSQVLAQ